MNRSNLQQLILRFLPLLCSIALVSTLLTTLITDSKSIPRRSSVTTAATNSNNYLRSSAATTSSSSSSSFTKTVLNNKNMQSATATTVHRRLPELIYGTAWKKEMTQPLVELAIKTGFRAIDTACQPKHYYEKGVGDALQKLYAEGIVTREDIFLQTKFTSLNGQDVTKPLPYDRNAPLQEQVKQSFATSQSNLQTSYLDSLVMHSPMSTFEDTMIVWKEFESFYKQGLVKALGISNCYQLSLLRQIYENAEIKPVFLQNRFYHESHYDKDIRCFCKSHDIQYQSFWTLTANPHILKSPLMSQLVKKYGKTKEQIFFRFVKSLGIIPLTGTTSETHMREDLDVVSFELDPVEVGQLEAMLY